MNLALVAVGGARGAAGRWSVGVLVEGMVFEGTTSWLLSTLLVNVVGTAALAWLAARDLDARAAAFWRTGVLGAFTTFSALAAAVADPRVGLGYGLASVAIGLAVAWSAGVLAERAGGRP